MKSIMKNLDLITLLAIVLMAISISIFDFDNFSWNNNSTSYLGIILFVALIAIKYLVVRNSKNEEKKV